VAARRPTLLLVMAIGAGESIRAAHLVARGQVMGVGPVVVSVEKWFRGYACVLGVEMSMLRTGLCFGRLSREVIE